MIKRQPQYRLSRQGKLTNMVCLDLWGWIWLACLVSLLMSCGNKSPRVPSKASFEELFELREKITAVGDSLAPLFSPAKPYITADKIYVCDFAGHHVNIYDKNGKLLVKLGERKGKGPYEFQTPYGVVVDNQGYIYVNDRGNSRIEIFNASDNLVKSFLVLGQIETIMVRNSGENVSIITVDVAPFPEKDGGNYLLREYNWDGKVIKTFGRYDKPFVLYSWAVTHDEQGRIYVANVLEPEVRIFEPTGKLWRTLRLSSPSVVPLQTKLNPEPQSMAELRAGLRVLREEQHTEVRALFFRDGFLFVLHALRHKGEDHQFILDIFDLEGNLIFYGIKIPGLVQCVTDKFYVMNEHAESEYGAIEVIGFQLKATSVLGRGEVR